jgi:ribulose-phosphate 3-epimerase
LSMKKIAPSVLSADFACVKEDIKKAEDAGADLLHLDVMDGHFVPNITFGPKMVYDINKISNLPLDVHLMISEPEKYIKHFADAGADWISVHYEAAAHLNRLINQVKDCGCKAGVVLNPASNISNLENIIEYTDFVLLMSVNPGFGGQSFIKNSLKKAKMLKEMINRIKPEVFIEMDGGIGPDNIDEVSKSGVDVFVCGNSVFGAKDPAKALKDMKKILSN